MRPEACSRAARVRGSRAMGSSSGPRTGTCLATDGGAGAVTLTARFPAQQAALPDSAPGDSADRSRQRRDSARVAAVRVGSKLPQHPPAGEVVISMRPVSVFADGPDSEIERLRAQLRGSWRQTARAAVVLLLSLHELTPAQIAGLLECHPGTAHRTSAEVGRPRSDYLHEFWHLTGQAGLQAERGEVRGIHQSVGGRSPAG
jgi:hypothetical protein